MGNSLGGGRKKTKVMKIDGETFKLKTPVRVSEVLNNYPCHVLMESEAVKHYGVRAKPLEPQQELKPKRLYFLVELPKFPEEKVPRRVRSSIQMSAKDRLESLMLARRSASDLSILKSRNFVDDEGNQGGVAETGGVRVKMRLPKSQVVKLVGKSKDEAEAAEKIMELCIASNNGCNINGFTPKGNGVQLLQQQTQMKNGLNSIMESFKTEKRVAFLPNKEENFVH